MFKIALIFVLIGRLALADSVADHEDLVHLTAHVGASYALNTFFYGMWSRAFRCNRWQALLMAGMTAFMIGAIYKGVEPGGPGNDVGTSFFRNGVGISLSAGTIVLFQF